MRPIHLFIGIALIALIVSAAPTHAAELSFAVRQASVVVQCGNRQGSGVVVNGVEGYVLTNAHVLMDTNTNIVDACTVGFITDESYRPSTFYAAEGDKYVYDEGNNRDFAILKIGQLIRGQPVSPFPFLMTNEFSKVSDPLTLVTYPRDSRGIQYVSSGAITLLQDGTIVTQAFIGHGSSGGPGLNDQNHLIGLAQGILYETDKSNEDADTPYAYQLVDIRNVLSWLDTFGPNVQNQYITHSDPDRYNAPAAFTNPTTLSCVLLAKSQSSSTVYCIKADGTRSVFPNDSTYVSWLSDFSSVTTLSDQDLASHRLTANVTMKTGSLVKIESDPRVYLVADAAGTLRWIPTEERTKELFGEGWAGFAKDIPVTFFSSYKIGEPLP